MEGIDSWADEMDEVDACLESGLPIPEPDTSPLYSTSTHQLPDQPPFRLFVGGLAPDASAEALAAAFGDLQVEDVVLRMDPEGLPCGQAAVKFASRQQLEAAIKMDALELGGRKLRLQLDPQELERRSPPPGLERDGFRPPPQRAGGDSYGSRSGPPSQGRGPPPGCGGWNDGTRSLNRGPERAGGFRGYDREAPTRREDWDGGRRPPPGGSRFMDAPAQRPYDRDGSRDYDRDGSRYGPGPGRDSRYGPRPDRDRYGSNYGPGPDRDGPRYDSGPDRDGPRYGSGPDRDGPRYGPGTDRDGPRYGPGPDRDGPRYGPGPDRDGPRYGHGPDRDGPRYGPGPDRDGSRYGPGPDRDGPRYGPGPDRDGPRYGPGPDRDGPRYGHGPDRDSRPPAGGRGNDSMPSAVQRMPNGRPKLNLKPRTVPAAEIGKPAASSSIFGGAKPVDTAAREREIEERLRSRERGPPRAERQLSLRHRSGDSTASDGRRPRLDSQRSESSRDGGGGDTRPARDSGDAGSENGGAGDVKETHEGGGGGDAGRALDHEPGPGELRPHNSFKTRRPREQQRSGEPRGPARRRSEEAAEAAEPLTRDPADGGPCGKDKHDEESGGRPAGAAQSRAAPPKRSRQGDSGGEAPGPAAERENQSERGEEPIGGQRRTGSERDGRHGDARGEKGRRGGHKDARREDEEQEGGRGRRGVEKGRDGRQTARQGNATKPDPEGQSQVESGDLGSARLLNGRYPIDSRGGGVSAGSEPAHQ